MTSFFSKYPKVRYNIQNRPLAPEVTITDIMFRVNILKNVINNSSAYYYHIVKDTDTPELLAWQIYGSTEAHWILLYANDIYDPINEWPKDYNSFNKFIVSKYGSIAAAQLGIHHYEMVVTRENVVEQVTDETRFNITQEKLTVNSLDVPFDYYEGTGSLEDTAGVETFDVGGKAVVVTKDREAISNYDYEYALNESRRKLKVIKKEFYGHVMSDFKRLTGPFTGRFTKTLKQGG